MNQNPWEVFDPRDGLVRFTVRYRWVARLLSKLCRVDYAQPGEGW